MVVEDAVFRAVAHPVRRRLLAMLAEGPRSVKEMTAGFAMSQPAVSQHLKELREAGLVRAERVGVEQRYRLTPEPLRVVVRWAERYRSLVDPAGHLWSFGSEGASGASRGNERKEGDGD